jgi:hypothetical protein
LGIFEIVLRTICPGWLNHNTIDLCLLSNQITGVSHQHLVLFSFLLNGALINPYFFLCSFTNPQLRNPLTIHIFPHFLKLFWSKSGHQDSLNTHNCNVIFSPTKNEQYFNIIKYPNVAKSPIITPIIFTVFSCQIRIWTILQLIICLNKSLNL